MEELASCIMFVLVFAGSRLNSHVIKRVNYVVEQGARVVSGMMPPSLCTGCTKETANC